MSEPKEKVDITDLKNAFLECPVCVEHFNQTDRRPRLLHSCLHAFCRLCLHQLLLKEGKEQITCPLCRHVQKVTGTVDSLPIDPIRDQLLDYLAITHKTNVLCNDCPDGNNANSRCLECGENLCQDCKNAHSRHKSTRGHRVVPFGELDQEAYGTLKIKHFCKNHSDRLIECFCENCKVLCCLLCAVIDHKGHDLKKLEDAAGVRIKEIETLITDWGNVHDKLATAMNDCETYAEDMQKEKRKLLSEVDAKFDSAEQLLRERRMSVRMEVEQSSERLAFAAKKKASLYANTLTEIKSIQTYFSNAKSKTDDVSVLQVYPSLKANLINLAKTHSGTIRKCSEKVTFNAAGEDNVHRHIRGYGVVNSIQTVEEMDWKKDLEKEYAEEVEKLVQWYYFEITMEGDDDMVPYDKQVNAKLERAFNKDKKKEWEYEGYVFDFENLNEYPKGDRADKVKMIRKDKVQVAAFNLPLGWEPMPHDRDLLLKQVLNGSTEFVIVNRTFLQALGKATAQIVRLDRIQNKTLYQRYSAKKQQMVRQNPSTTVERSLWHATQAQDYMSISSYGLNRSYCDKDRSALGEGAYINTDAGYAARNRYAPADAQGRRYMFMCKVLTGTFTQGVPNIRVPPAKDPSKPEVLYDSVVDDTNAPKTFVIFSDTQAYPEYLISFQ